MKRGPGLLLLLTAIAFAAAAAATMSSQILRAITGTVLVFLLPGYLLTKVLWPERGQIPGVRRLSLVVPSSILAAGGTWLLLSYFCGYQPEGAILALVLLNAALALCAYARRKNAPADEEHLRGKHVGFHLSRPVPRFNRWHALPGLAAVVLVGSIVYAIMRPGQTANYTEFYLLTADGQPPVAGQDFGDFGSVLHYVIRNYEGQPMDYRLSVVAVTPEGRRELWSELVPVAEGAAVQAAVDFSTAPPDSRQILWLLFLPGQREPYRSLRFMPD
jgi:uncharacterized membrane protein